MTAFAVAKTTDDDSTTFSYHMLAGLLLASLVILRLLWGFWGPRHSRFSDFALAPQQLIGYFKSILSGDKPIWEGHNPASSWAALLMFALALGLGLTGFLMTTGASETLEDIHELLANAFLVVALMHVAGLVLHVLRHRDGLPLAMISGKKNLLSSSESIPSAKPMTALLFLALFTVSVVHLINNFDGQTRTLKLFGTQLQLGENEGGENGNHGESADEGADEDNESEED